MAIIRVSGKQRTRHWWLRPLRTARWLFSTRVQLGIALPTKRSPLGHRRYHGRAKSYPDAMRRDQSNHRPTWGRWTALELN